MILAELYGASLPAVNKVALEALILRRNWGMLYQNFTKEP